MRQTKMGMLHALYADNPACTNADDCGLLNKKEPPPVGAEGGSLCKTVTMFTVPQKER